MKFFATGSQIISELESLTSRCKSLRWAVAWASHSAPFFPGLVANAHKIAQLTIGVHFYQTSPEFIEAFMTHGHAQFVMNPSGVFHPKIYYFEHEDGRWNALVGSANFTRSAFTVNNECAVLFSDSDVDAERARHQILTSLDAYRALGQAPSVDNLEAYRTIWTRQQRKIGSLSGQYSEPERHSKSRSQRAARSPLEVPLFRESWEEHFRAVTNEPPEQTVGRLAVLEGARELFLQHGHFRDMPEHARAHVAGYRRTTELDWLWFGSMRGAGNFKNAVKQNQPRLSAALDHIPLTGEVSEAAFSAYLEEMRGAYRNPGTGTVTRLLAMKRPDYFLCLDSRNKKQLCRAFGLKRSVGLDQYWPQIVERILDSNWWNAPEPAPEMARRIWRCRVAFLDVRFYEPRTSKAS